MVDWLTVRKKPIEAVEHGVNVAADGDLFNSTHTGPRTFDRIEYPVAEVLPDETTRSGPTNWDHSIFANLYFERGREMDYVDDVLHPTAEVVEQVLAELATVECVTNYYPEFIQDFAGELDNTSVLLVSIRFRATSQIDPADF